MLVHIPDALASRIAHDRRVATELKHLFVLFERGCHEWLLEEDDNAEIYADPVFDSFREFIQKRVTASIYENRNLVHVVHVVATDQITEISESLKGRTDLACQVYLRGDRMVVRGGQAVHEYISVDVVGTFLGQPLKVLVENSESDALFIETCLLHIGGVDINTLWLSIDHGGGSDIEKVVKRSGGRERLVCVVDGDWTAPGEMPSTEWKFKERLKATCGKLGCALHILFKREMENYLPDDAIKRYLLAKGCRSPEAHVYFTLTEEQKDYFDLKKGLRKRDLKSPIWSMFNVPSTETAASSDGRDPGLPGFGEEVWEAFKHVRCRGELESRDRVGELKLLVEMILDLL